MKIAIVGAGAQAQLHISYAKENEEVQLEAICDVDKKKAEETARKFGIQKTYRNLTELLENYRPDAVHIVTPPKYHAKLALEAIEAGCHLLIEKPMALSVADAEEILKKSNEKGIKVCVCHSMLFEPEIVKAKELYESKQVGDLINLETYMLHGIGDSPSYAFEGKNTGWAYDLPGSVFSNFIDHAIYLQNEFLGEISVVSVTTDKIGDNPFVPFDELL